MYRAVAVKESWGISLSLLCVYVCLCTDSDLLPNQNQRLFISSFEFHSEKHSIHTFCPSRSFSYPPSSSSLLFFLSLSFFTLLGQRRGQFARIRTISYLYCNIINPVMQSFHNLTYLLFVSSIHSNSLTPQRRISCVLACNMPQCSRLTCTHTYGQRYDSERTRAIFNQAIQRLIFIGQIKFELIITIISW